MGGCRHRSGMLSAVPSPLPSLSSRRAGRTRAVRWSNVPPVGALVALVALIGLVVLATPVSAEGLTRLVASTTETAMTWWKAAVLGIVEGISEYLPISSTGHLLVTSRLLGLGSSQADIDAANTYAVAIQFGAILAVAGLFWKRFRDMLLGLVGRSPEGRRLLVNLVIAFVPSALVGAVFDKKIEDHLFSSWAVVIAWGIGGTLILLLEARGMLPDRGEPRGDGDPLIPMTTRQAFIIGLAQILALWPGVSRSLTTIVAALLVGMGMSAAVEFSFLLGVVTLTAATAFKLAKDGPQLVDQFGYIDPLIGALFAFVAAVLAVKWLIRYLERHDLTIFGWYRIAICALGVGLILGGAI